MSIETRLNAINDHLVDDYSVLTLAGADLTNVDKNIVNLKPTWKERLLYFMNNGTDTVWNNWEKVVGEGTSLTLSNTEQAPMKVLLSPSTTTQNTITGEVGTEVVDTSINVSDLNTSKENYITLKGNTYQFTTTGKNKLQYTLEDLKTNNTGGTWNNNVYTWNGITFTINDDLSVKVNGTATAASYLYVNFYNLGLTSGTEYILNGCPSGGSVSSYSLRLYDGNTYSSDLGNGLTFTFNTQTIVRVNVSNGTTVNNLTFYPMIRLSSVSDSTYEPYTNGPSPNPTYPQNIEVVTGSNDISVVGKNLFRGDFSQFDNVGGTGSTYGYFKLPDDGEVYTLKLTCKNTFTTTRNLYLGFTANGGDNSGGYSWALSASTGQTITAGYTNTKSYSSYRFISLYGNNENVLNEIMDNFEVQLEKGSTATTYEAYQGNTYEVNLGKNLFNINGTHSTTSCTVSIADNTLTQTNTGTYSRTVWGITNLIVGQPYTFSCNYSNASSSSILISIRDSANSSVIVDSGVITNTSGTIKVSFVATETTHNIRIYSNSLNSANSAVVSFSNIMLEKGSTATTYAPYFTPIELCKIGNYQDRIFKSGDKWYLHKEIGKVVLNGSEDWAYTNSSFRLPITNINTSGNNIVKQTSNYYQGITYSSTWSSYDYFVCNTLDGNLVIKNKDYTSSNDFKTWLSTHNTEVYYVLATPTNTEITNNDLITQLNALYNATTYSTTNINTTTSNLLPYIDLRYNVVTPSPSPEIPSEIKVVSGDNTIVSTGKNLFSGYVKGIGLSGTTGAQTTDANSATSDFIPLDITGTNRFKVWGLPTTISSYVAAYNKEKQFLGRTGGTTTGTFDLSPTAFGAGSPTATGDVVYVRVTSYKISTSTGTIDDVDNAQVMLERGTTATTYEPYRGTNYNVNLPIENVLDFDTILNYWGAVYTKENGTYTLTDRGSFYANQYTLNLEVGKIYTLSGVQVEQTSSNLRLEILEDSNIVAIQRFSPETTVSGKTFTVKEGKTYTIRGNYSTGSYPMIFSKPQLEEGTKTNAYTPYGTTPIELCKIGTYQDRFIRTTGKNLLEPNSFAQKIIDSPYSSANASTYDSETGELSIKMGNSSVVFDNFKANTRYTIILKYNIATNGSNLQITYTDNTTQNITPTAGSGIFRLVTTEGKSVASIKHSAYDSTTPRILYLKESGIFEGVIETNNFEPYGSGDWYLEKNIGNLVLNGSENWTLGETNTNTMRFVCNSLINAFSSTTTNYFTNYFEKVSQATQGTDDSENLCIRNDLSGIGVRMLITRVNDLAGYKSWLSEHNTRIDYINKTPIYTKIEGTLKEQLEEVYRAKSYENETNVSQQNYDLPFVLSVSALSQEV